MHINFVFISLSRRSFVVDVPTRRVSGEGKNKRDKLPRKSQLSDSDQKCQKGSKLPAGSPSSSPGRHSDRWSYFHGYARPLHLWERGGWWTHPRKRSEAGHYRRRSGCWNLHRVPQGARIAQTPNMRNLPSWTCGRECLGHPRIQNLELKRHIPSLHKQGQRHMLKLWSGSIPSYRRGLVPVPCTEPVRFRFYLFFLLRNSCGFV